MRREPAAVESGADSWRMLSGHSLISETNRLRVLHVHSGNLYGGVETTLITQARHRELCPAMKLSLALCFAGRFSEELAAAGACVHWLGHVRVRQPLSIRRARQSFRDLLRQQSYDVVVTHSSWSQAIFGPVARSVAVPLVFYLHNETNGRYWLERWARRTLPDAALCNSQFTAATLPMMYPHVRAEVVYCPVAPPEHNSSETDASAARAELQTPEDATVIIQVSRMEAWKGHTLHLEALSLLKDLPGWVCWQVGGAQRPGEMQYVAELKKAAARLGIAERVRFPGQRTDVARLLAAADIYCQPNTGPEPFGITFIEALYARLPIVTTAIGGACEIVDDSCGLFVPPGDTRALASSLRRLIQDRSLRVRLGTAGPSRAHKLCDPAAQMNRLNAALACVVRGRRVDG